jgi:16S rRNA G1207 methylase RsmC
MDTLSTPYGKYNLQRLPVIKNNTLRAWDAADELILKHIHEQRLITAKHKILLVNDQFGALSISLNNYSIQNWSDSYQSHLATQQNLLLNQLTGTINYIPSTDEPAGLIDLVIIKIPKTLALLHDQLIKLKNHIRPDTTIIAAGMVKHIHTSTLKHFETVIGTTTTSLSTKKARLIFPQFTNNKKMESRNSINPSFPISFYDKTWDLQLSNHANVFAKEKLDVGARFMLDQFKNLPKSKYIIDLGCGNGVLGIIAQRQQPESQVTFVDESYMAIDSTKTNYQTIFQHNQADFLVSDTLSNFKQKKVDLILCNPPFHQQYAIGDHLAWEMFKQSRENLETGGKLWIVGNRHLNYHIKLKRLFGNYQNIAANKKFVVLAAKR